MTATAHPPVPVGAGTRLLGEVIAWACPGVNVTHTDLVAAPPSRFWTKHHTNPVKRG